MEKGETRTRAHAGRCFQREDDLTVEQNSRRKSRKGDQVHVEWGCNLTSEKILEKVKAVISGN
jgi:hypothetical protein